MSEGGMRRSETGYKKGLFLFFAMEYTNPWLRTLKPQKKNEKQENKTYDTDGIFHNPPG